jgi:hypothetical protein
MKAMPLIPMRYSLVSVVAICCGGLLGTPTDAQVKTCAAAEVRSISFSVETGKDWPLSDTASIAVIPQTPVSPAASERMLAVRAYGPVFGSMDSPQLGTEFACTKRGVILTATIIRSANYHGAVRQNQLWSPIISIALVPRQFEVMFDVVWKMRLTDGQFVDRARTPPYPEQKYPVIVTKTLW